MITLDSLEMLAREIGENDMTREQLAEMLLAASNPASSFKERESDPRKLAVSEEEFVFLVDIFLGVFLNFHLQFFEVYETGQLVLNEYAAQICTEPVSLKKCEPREYPVWNLQCCSKYISWIDGSLKSSS